jgi:hypothetical protein
MAIQTNFPAIKPTLLLDFANTKQLDPRVTFTRASTGTYFDQLGVMRTAASGVARFEHNPITFESLGLEIEEQRTNLVTYSDDFANAAWTKTEGTITANTVVSPDGTLNGDKFIESTTASSVHVLISAAATGVLSTTYVASFYIKSAERTRARVVMTFGGSNGVYADADLSAGTVGAATALNTATAGVSTITSVGNGWFRVTVSGSSSASTSITTRVEILDASGNRSYTGNGSSGIFIWGAQLEAGAFPTSYIQTVASQVTRAADAASMTGTNFSSWYNQAQGTFFVDGSTNRPYSASVGGQFLSPAADSSNRMWIAQGNTTNFVQVNGQSGGSGQWDFFVGSAPVANQQTRAALAYSINDIAASGNGSAVGTDTSATIPSVTQLTIGVGVTLSAGSTINGTIRKIAYYPLRVTNANLQALTS